MYLFIIAQVPHQDERSLLARLGVNASAAVRVHIDTRNTKHMPEEVSRKIALLAAKAWAFDHGFTNVASFVLLSEDDLSNFILKMAKETLTVEL